MKVIFKMFVTKDTEPKTNMNTVVLETESVLESIPRLNEFVYISTYEDSARVAEIYWNIIGDLVTIYLDDFCITCEDEMGMLLENGWKAKS